MPTYHPLIHCKSNNDGLFVRSTNVFMHVLFFFYFFFQIIQISCFWIRQFNQKFALIVPIMEWNIYSYLRLYMTFNAAIIQLSYRSLLFFLLFNKGNEAPGQREIFEVSDEARSNRGAGKAIRNYDYLYKTFKWKYKIYNTQAHTPSLWCINVW